MTYTTSDPSILIARGGYAGLGAMDRTTAATFCGQKFGVTSKDFQPCVDHYAAGKPGDYSPGVNANAGSPSTLSQVGTFFGGLLSGAVNSYAASKGAANATPVMPVSTTPPWLVPVAIGGIGLVAILMLRKKRSAPVSNPARRRRRRRSRR